MMAAEFRLCLLDNEVVAVEELRTLRVQAERRDRAREIDSGQTQRQRNRAGPGNEASGVRPRVREPKFIGITGRERVAVREKEILMAGRVLLNKARKRYHGGKCDLRVGGEAPGHAVGLGLIMIDSNDALRT